MNKFSIIVLLFFSSITNAFSQTTISGIVRNEKGIGQADISVVIMCAGNDRIVGFTFSEDDGNYELSYNGTCDSLTVKVSGLNIESKSVAVANRNQIINFIVKERITQLREVVATAQKIWGTRDTLNYLVSAFASSKDLVIGDVLKKMPGIDVKESGQITYKGKPINKFYIENLDLLQGRYGIATNNISAKDVAAVQVYENHQPVKALEDIKFSDQAAINLKLKDEAKGTLSIMAKLGLGGFPLIWNNELAGMYFARTKQNITTYKCNNSGNDLTKELSSFTPVTVTSGNEYVFLKMPSPPEINKNRYLYNNSNAITANNLFKTSESGQLNLNLIYYNDHENRDSYARSSYLLSGDSMQIISEKLSSGYNTDRLEGEARYNYNENKMYFNNYLNFSGMWEHGVGDIITEQNIHQRLKNPSFTVSDVQHIVKRYENEKGFELLSTVSFKTQPQELVVSPAIYDNLFDNCENVAAEQDARTNTFVFDNSFTLLSAIMIGNIRISPRVGLNMKNQNMNSELYPVDDSGEKMAAVADSMRNRINWSKYVALLSADITYNVYRVKASLHIPVSYNYILFNNKVLQDKQDLSKVYIQPSFSFKYEMPADLDFVANYYFYNGTNSPNTLYTGYVLQNYRSLNRYDSRLSENNGNGGDVKLSYKDIFSMFFAGIGANYNYNKRNVLYGQNFDGIVSTSSMLEIPNSSNNVSFNGNISKGFDWLKLLVKLNGTYGISSSQYLQQDEVVDYKSNGFNIGGSLSAQIMRRLLFSYKGTYGESKGKVKGGENFTAIRSFVNNFSLDIPLIKDFDLNLSHEMYYNSAAIGNKSFSLTDAEIRFKKGKITYSLNCTNIFNTKKYISAYYDAINTYYSAYDIRPVNVLLKVSFKLK